MTFIIAQVLNRLVAAGAVLILMMGAAIAGHGTEPVTMNVDAKNVAINGYDTVAYFTKSEATSGSQEHTFVWREAEWQFASAQHRALFISNPEKYAPQYGAFCALGVSLNMAVTVDPEAWTIVEDKLYINYNMEYRDKWREDTATNISKANTAWSPHVPMQ